MSREELVCEVRDDEIIVTLPDTGFGVTYFKPADLPQLIANKFPRENEKGAALTHSEFLARAWKLANDEARELGWIV
jgi:hypothetical protein